MTAAPESGNSQTPTAIHNSGPGKDLSHTTNTAPALSQGHTGTASLQGECYMHTPARKRPNAARAIPEPSSHPSASPEGDVV